MRRKPLPIIINEALEIVKEFSDHEGTQFVNGILDAASREFRKEEFGANHKGKKHQPAPPAEAPIEAPKE